jgi:hypothetical protein
MDISENDFINQLSLVMVSFRYSGVGKVLCFIVNLNFC